MEEVCRGPGVGGKMPAASIDFAVIPDAVESDDGHGMTGQVIEIVAIGTLDATAQSIIDILCRAASVHLHETVFRVVGVVVEAIVDDVAQGIVGDSSAGDVIVEVETILRRRPRSCSQILLRTIPISVICIVKCRLAGVLVGTYKSVELVVAEAPVAVDRVVGRSDLPVRRPAESKRVTRGATTAAADCRCRTGERWVGEKIGIIVGCAQRTDGSSERSSFFQRQSDRRARDAGLSGEGLGVVNRLDQRGGNLGGCAVSRLSFAHGIGAAAKAGGGTNSFGTE